MLTFEAILMLLSILVLNGFSRLSEPAAAAVGGGMALACVVAIAGMGRRWGYGLGHALQVAMVATGFLATPILFVGVLFAALWVVGYVIGMRIDAERAIR